MTIVKLKIHPSSPRIGKGTPLSESFRDYTLGLIGRLRLSDRCRTAESYLTSFNSFMRFRDDVDVSLDKIDADLMTAYEGYLRREGICPNTSSYYMRNLRAIYNRAVEDGLAVQCYPFRRVYTGIDRTVSVPSPCRSSAASATWTSVSIPVSTMPATSSCSASTPVACPSSTWPT